MAIESTTPPSGNELRAMTFQIASFGRSEKTKPERGPSGGPVWCSQANGKELAPRGAQGSQGSPAAWKVLLGAQRLGYVGRSESEQLYFFAAAAHAVTVGRHNPSSLFANIIRRSLWRYLSFGDEDCAEQASRVTRAGTFAARGREESGRRTRQAEWLVR